MGRQGKAIRVTNYPSERTASSNGDTATRERVIEAAVACILERGFYRASTNEIARQAGVTWGVIQHYFGTREALMVSVLQHGARRFVDLVDGVHVEGETVEARIEKLLDILSAHYAQPEFLAYLQILLNMDGDPRTSADVRTTMREVAEQSNTQIRRLLRETIGAVTGVPELETTVFLVLRGFGISQQLLETMAYDTLVPKRKGVARQRHLLAAIIAPYIERVTEESP